MTANQIIPNCVKCGFKFEDELNLKWYCPDCKLVVRRETAKASIKRKRAEKKQGFKLKEDE